MAAQKVHCFSCTANKECSRSTKAFVNYCGSRPEMYAEQIRDAIADCLARKGYLFKRIQPIAFQEAKVA
jgi:hypothetical protein